MPRFYFDFRQDGHLQADHVGVEFDSSEHAYLAAMEGIRGMWGELLAKRQDPRRCAFLIRGEEGGLLFSVPFGEVLESCRGESKPATNLHRTMQEARAICDSSRKLQMEMNHEYMSARRTLRESARLLAKVI